LVPEISKVLVHNIKLEFYRVFIWVYLDAKYNN